MSVFSLYLDDKRSLVECDENERAHGECCFSIKNKILLLLVFIYCIKTVFLFLCSDNNNSGTLKMHCRALLPHQSPPPPTLSSTPSSPSLLNTTVPNPFQDQNCVCYARQTTVDDPQCTQCKQRIHLICAEQWFHANFNIRQCPYCRFTPMFSE